MSLMFKHFSWITNCRRMQINREKLCWKHTSFINSITIVVSKQAACLVFLYVFSPNRYQLCHNIKQSSFATSTCWLIFLRVLSIHFSIQTKDTKKTIFHALGCSLFRKNIEIRSNVSERCIQFIRFIVNHFLRTQAYSYRKLSTSPALLHSRLLLFLCFFFQFRLMRRYRCAVQALICSIHVMTVHCICEIHISLQCVRRFRAVQTYRRKNVHFFESLICVLILFWVKLVFCFFVHLFLVSMAVLSVKSNATLVANLLKLIKDDCVGLQKIYYPNLSALKSAVESYEEYMTIEINSLLKADSSFGWSDVESNHKTNFNDFVERLPIRSNLNRKKPANGNASDGCFFVILISVQEWLLQAPKGEKFYFVLEINTLNFSNNSLPPISHNSATVSRNYWFISYDRNINIRVCFFLFMTEQRRKRRDWWQQQQKISKNNSDRLC